MGPLSTSDNSRVLRRDGIRDPNGCQLENCQWGAEELDFQSIKMINTRRSPPAIPATRPAIKGLFELLSRARSTSAVELVQRRESVTSGSTGIGQIKCDNGDAVCTERTTESYSGAL